MKPASTATRAGAPGRASRRARARARYGTLIVVALAAMVAASGPPAARADCGGVVTAQPAHPVTAGVAPLAVGDSTMLYALPALAAEGFAVNAHGCRQFPEAVSLLASLAAAGQLPHLVVIALGANGSVTPDDVSAALRVLGPTRVLGLVTPRQLGGAVGPNATVVHDAEIDHPQVRVLDWVAFSAGQPSWFQPDGLHLTLAGAAAFARLLATALPFAAPSPSAITLTARGADGGVVQIPLGLGWQLVSGRPDAAVLLPPGRCDYRVTFSARTLPPSTGASRLRDVTAAREVRALAPPGVALGPVGAGPGDAARQRAWLTWREHGTPIIGGEWAAPRAHGPGLLGLDVHSALTAGCSIGVAHRVRGALFALLARTRPI